MKPSGRALRQNALNLVGLHQRRVVGLCEHSHTVPSAEVEVAGDEAALCGEQVIEGHAEQLASGGRVDRESL